jgi:hypothetical protein
MPVPWCRALLVDLLVERWWAGRAFAGTLVPTGSRPDIGAFERGGVAPGISYEDSFDGAATGPSPTTRTGGGSSRPEMRFA